MHLTFRKMEKYLSVFLKYLIAGLNRAQCPMLKIIILLKIEKMFEKHFPADFIAEGLTRHADGFIRLTVLALRSF